MSNHETTSYNPTPNQIERFEERRKQIQDAWLALATDQCEAIATAKHLSTLIAIVLRSDETTPAVMDALGWCMLVQERAMEAVSVNYESQNKG